MTISRVKFPWPPFFRIFIFFDEVFNFVCGTTYLMRDDGATVVNLNVPSTLKCIKCSCMEKPYGRFGPALYGISVCGTRGTPIHSFW